MNWFDRKAKSNTWNWYIFQRCSPIWVKQWSKESRYPGYTKNRQHKPWTKKRLVTWVLEKPDNFRHRNFCRQYAIGGEPKALRNPAHIRNVSKCAADCYWFSLLLFRDNGAKGSLIWLFRTAVKPQSDRDYVKLIVPGTKSHYFKIPEEMLADNDVTEWNYRSWRIAGKEDDLLLNQVCWCRFVWQRLTTATNSTAVCCSGCFSSWELT